MHEACPKPSPDVRPSVCWLAQTLTEVPQDDSWLSVKERAIAGRMHFEKRCRDWRLGRWTAKRAVLSLLGLPLDADQSSKLEILAAADGAPEAFMDGAPAPISLSISHSGKIGFCALASAGSALGCDLEEVRPLEKNFAADYFDVEELRLVDSAPPPERLQMIYLIWSAKESALKALRQGLRLDTRSVRVSLLEKERYDWNSLEIIELESSRTFRGWWQMRGDHIRTIATDLPTDSPTEILLPPRSS